MALILDARPVRKGDTRLEIVEDLLDSAEDLVHVDNVLVDWEFDSQHILEEISQRGHSYVVPKRMHTSEKAQAKRLLKRDADRYESERKLHLGNNEWHETTLIYRRNEGSEHIDFLEEYGVSMGYREWLQERETVHGLDDVKELRAPILLLAFACLLYSIWRAVNLLVLVSLTGNTNGHQS